MYQDHANLQLDRVENRLDQLFLPGDRQLDRDERRLHDNYGQPPRNDDSDDENDDDDDFHHRPGARIRRPITPDAGPIPAPINAPEPVQAAANAHTAVHPDPIYTLDQISAMIRARQSHWPVAGEAATPTPTGPFTNIDDNYIHPFADIQAAVKALHTQYEEYTASKSFLYSPPQLRKKADR